MDKQKMTIEISMKSIVKVFLVILGFIFLYYVRNLILLVFVVLIIVAGLDPTLIFFDKFKIPRWLSVSFLYLILFGLSTLFLCIVIPPLVDQSIMLLNNLPYLVNNLPYSIADYLKEIVTFNSSKVFSLSGQVISFFGSLGAFLIVLIISFYLLLKHESVEETFFSFISKDKREKSIRIYRKISAKLGNWLRSRVLLSIIVTVVMFIILKILGVPYALTLAVLAGILDIVPIIGPIIAGIIIGIVILATGFWWQIFIALGLYIILMQVQASYMVPKMMGKAIGLSPVIIILVFALGAKLGGVMGAILAIPIAAGVFVIIQEWNTIKKVLFN